MLLHLTANSASLFLGKFYSAAGEQRRWPASRLSPGILLEAGIINGGQRPCARYHDTMR